MLVIRFFRVGKKHQPSFKIVVTDKRKPPRSGRFVEEVGFYNPLTKEKILRGERIKYWLSVGAKPSNTVHNLLVSEKIIEEKKIDVHKKSKEKKGKPIEEKPKEEPKVEAKPAEETPKDYNPPTSSSHSPKGEWAPKPTEPEKPIEPEKPTEPEKPKEEVSKKEKPKEEKAE